MPIEISLDELNESYQALVRLAQGKIPKEQHKLSYKIMRIYKQAKPGVEEMGESLRELMRKCGFEPGQSEVKAELMTDFTKQSKKFLRETPFAFTWGDPIPIQEIIDHVQIQDPMTGTWGMICAKDRGDLAWLFIEEE